MDRWSAQHAGACTSVAGHKYTRWRMLTNFHPTTGFQEQPENIHRLLTLYGPLSIAAQPIWFKEAGDHEHKITSSHVVLMPGALGE
jgi:hypothetical protein